MALLEINSSFVLGMLIYQRVMKNENFGSGQVLKYTNG